MEAWNKAVGMFGSQPTKLTDVNNALRKRAKNSGNVNRPSQKAQRVIR